MARDGIEPPTQGFSVLCSTAELPGLVVGCECCHLTNVLIPVKYWMRQITG